MDISCLKEFLSLAETCNYQETAERMHVSQSSLSKHIQRLERDLGVSLFSRTTRSVKLNDYGLTFLNYARQIVFLSDECRNDLNKRKLSDTCHLSVGYQPDLGQYGIIEVLSDFSRAYPQITLDMVEENHPTELLRSHRCNFVFSGDYRPADGDIERLPYECDNLAAVFPLDHPLAREPRVSIRQLQNQNFIMHQNSTASEEFQDFRRLCSEAGFEPNVVMVTIFKSNILKFVRQGKGIAVMNRLQTQYTDNSGLAIVDIHPPIQFNIHVLYAKGRTLSNAENVFLQYIAARK